MTTAPTDASRLPISDRALNRATLARQLLLERSTMGATELIEHLVGLQAQEPTSWYTGFWSRLVDFDPTEVSRLLVDREVVRIALMRSTIHLVTASDALTLRPLLQRAVEKPMTGYWRRQLKDLHADEIVAAGRAALDAGPLTAVELGAALERLWPDIPGRDLAMAARVWIPLVQVPPRGVWGAHGAAKHAALESWVQRAPGPTASVDDLVLRYLRAYGPATPADAQAWCGLTRLREVFERLRPQLVTFIGEDGRELFDLPDAPRPDPDTPAPARFIYDYDNLILSHADRSRFVSEELRTRLLAIIANYSYGSLLVDGIGRGIWRIEREGDSVVLIVRLVWPLMDAEMTEVEHEGSALLAFWAPHAENRVLRFSLLEE